MHWILTRADTDEAVRLHPQFFWVDEFDWQALAQSDSVYTLTGAMDIQQGTKKAGRPITLNGDNTRTKRSDLTITPSILNRLLVISVWTSHYRR